MATPDIHSSDYAGIGGGISYDDAAFEDMIGAAALSLVSGMETHHGVNDIYTGRLPRIHLEAGRYRLSSRKVIPPYFLLSGSNAVIVQDTEGEDILYTDNAYDIQISGVQFIGGRHQANLGNANTDSAMFIFERCKFILGESDPIKTFATGGWSHMSANLTVRDSKFSRNNGGVDSCCDSTSIVDTWVKVVRDNFDADRAVFKSRGDSGRPRLYLKNMFGVPSMGAGSGRVPGVRWVDAYGTLKAEFSRFGGEEGGMPVVKYFGPAQSAYPFVGNSVSIHDCECYGGPSVEPDNAVVILAGQVPQHISLRDNDKNPNTPFILNPLTGGVNFASYFAAYETSSGRCVDDVFTIDIRSNSGLHSGAIPAELRRFLVDGRRTVVRRNTAQAISAPWNTANFISFNVVEENSAQAFDPAAPTVLKMPANATRATLWAHVRVSSADVGKITGFRIVNTMTPTSGDIQSGSSIASHVNIDGNGYDISAPVTAPGGAPLYIQVLTNDPASITLLYARASITPLDALS